MKVRMKWRFSAGLLALMLALGACSSNGGEPGTNAGPTSTPENQQPSGSTAPAETEREKVAIKIMANLPNADISEADKAIMEQLEKDLNVNVTWVIPPASGYKEQLQLSLVSGDYADIVFFSSETDESFQNAVKDGVLVPINPYLDQLPNIKAYTYDVTWEALDVKRDGNYYGIPRTSVARNDGFELRADWLKNVGIELPENHEVTIEQFNEILEKFTFNDPDQNNKNDTYGFGAFLNASKLINPVLVSQFGDLGWQESKGGDNDFMTAKYNPTADAYKKVLGYTQKLFKEGLVDPDAAVIDAGAANDRFLRGITGVRTQFAGYVPTDLEELRKNNPEADLTYLFVKDESDELRGAAFGTAMFGVWGLTNKAKHPERALEVFDWLLSDKGWDLVKFGVEGVEYNLVDGTREYIEGVNAPWRKSLVRRAYDGDFFIDAKYSPEVKAQVKPWVDRAIETVVFSKDKGFVPQASKDPVFQDYKLIWDETITRIMVGDLPVDAYDQLLSNWYEKGGAAYVEQMNEYIASTEK